MIKINLLLILSFWGFSGAQAETKNPGARLETACLERMKAEPKREAICTCLKNNLEKKAKLEEMELLAQTYEGDKVAEAKLEKEEFQALSEFDSDVSVKCTQNPGWKMPEEKKAGPKRSGAKKTK